MIHPFANIYRDEERRDILVSAATPDDFVIEMARLMLEHGTLKVTATFPAGIIDQDFETLMDAAAELAAGLYNREG